MGPSWGRLTAGRSSRWMTGPAWRDWPHAASAFGYTGPSVFCCVRYAVGDARGARSLRFPANCLVAQLFMSGPNC